MDAANVVTDVLRRWKDCPSLSSDPRQLFPQEIAGSFALCEMAAAQVISDFAESVGKVYARRGSGVIAPETKELADVELSSRTSSGRSSSATEQSPDFGLGLGSENSNFGERHRRSRKRITPSRVEASEASTLSNAREQDPSSTLSVFARKVPSHRGSRAPVSRGRPAPDSLGKDSSPAILSEEARTDYGNAPCLQLILADAMRQLVADPLTSRRATLHANCLKLSPLDPFPLSSALSTLADALRPTFWQDGTRDEFSFVGVFELAGSGLKSALHLTAHAALVLASVHELIRVLPWSLQSAVMSNTVLETCLPNIFGNASPLRRRLRSDSFVFPVPQESIHFCRPGCVKEVPGLTAPLAQSDTLGPRRLSANIENVWDKVLDLQRIYRGDLSSIPPGHLDRAEVTRCFRDLHPANVDEFAARFLGLLMRSVSSADNTDDRLKMLSSRLTGPVGVGRARHGIDRRQRGNLLGRRGDGISQCPVGVNNGSRECQGVSSTGVVLHRLPNAVRKMFNEASEMFFLEFIDFADSCRLNVALSTRLSMALYSALDRAANCSADAAFTDAVLEARLCARFLSVTMHIANWAHSNLSFSGDGAYTDESHRANTLPHDVTAMRALICSTMWQSLMDLHGIVERALATEHAPALVAAVMVSDVALRAAAADPIAPHTAWFVNTVDLLRMVALWRLDDTDRAWFVVPCGMLIWCAIEDLLIILPCAIGGSCTLRRELSSAGSEAAKEASMKTRNVHPASSSVHEELEVPVEVFDSNLRDTRDVQSIGDLRLIQACVPALEDFRRRIMDRDVMVSTGVMGQRRMTPYGTHTPDALLRGSSARAQNDADNESRDDCAPVNATKVQDDVRRDLWHEFDRTLDARVVDLAKLIAADPKTGAKRRRKLMLQISELLLPDVPQAAIRVAVWRYFGRSGATVDQMQPISDIHSDQEDDICNQRGLSRDGDVRSQSESKEGPAHPSEGISKITRLAWEPNDANKDVDEITHVLQEMGLRSSAG